MPSRTRSGAALKSEHPAVTQSHDAARRRRAEEFGRRLDSAMTAHRQATGKPFTQKDLVYAATRYVGRDPENDAIMTQQAISKIIRGKTDKCEHTAAIAAVLGVSAAWLQYGKGPPTLLEMIEEQRTKNDN